MVHSLYSDALSTRFMYYKLGFMAHHNTFSFPFLLHRQRKGKKLRIAKKLIRLKN